MLLEHLSLAPGSPKSPVVGSTNTNEEGWHFMTTGVSIHISISGPGLQNRIQNACLDCSNEEWRHYFQPEPFRRIGLHWPEKGGIR